MKRFFSSLADRPAMLSWVGSALVRWMASFSLTFRERRISKFLAALTLSAAVVSISGCHPCSILSHCGAEIIHAEALVGDDGIIYIDIPEKKKGQPMAFISISVSRIGSGSNLESYWSVWKTDKAGDDTDDFPVRYGEAFDAKYVKTIKSPVAIENGAYEIDGFAAFFDKDGRHPRTIKGRFTYNNGVVRNP